MLKDQRDLLLEFNAQNVKYLVIGGYAYSYYAEPRATKDLDLFIEASAENSKLVFAALTAFGAPLQNMTADNFGDGTSWYQVGVSLSRVDTQSIHGIDFEAAWNSSEAGTVDNDIPVRYISAEDLIKNKPAVGRTRDLADVEDLRAAIVANSPPITQGE